MCVGGRGWVCLGGEDLLGGVEGGGGGRSLMVWTLRYVAFTRRVGERRIWGGVFVFVPVEVHGFLVACSDRSLAVRIMGVKGCSEGHSSVERPVHEIPRWTLPRTRQRSGSPVECSLPYIFCWSIWVGRLYGDGHTIPLVGELG